MLAELKHTLLRLRGQMIGWGLGVAAYGLLMVYIYDAMAGLEGLTELLAAYPEDIMAFFGDLMRIATPQGYLDLYFFDYMPMVIGIFAAASGASLLVGDEEKGLLDLVLAYPVSRTALYWGRLLGLLCATLVILLAAWLSLALPAAQIDMGLAWHEFLPPFVSLLAVLLLVSLLALLLSHLLPSARLAGALSAGLVFANWLLLGLGNVNDDLQAIVPYTPLYYYQGGDAFDGLNGAWLGGLLAAAAILALLAWRLFLGRDIRVGGEGGWRLPVPVPWRRRRKKENRLGPARP